MIEITFSAANQYSAPMFLPQKRVMAISLSGTFDATVQIQRLIKEEGDSSYPAHDDTKWLGVNSYTSPTEDQVTDGDNCWYRAYCSVYVSGSPVVRARI